MTKYTKDTARQWANNLRKLRAQKTGPTRRHQTPPKTTSVVGSTPLVDGVTFSAPWALWGVGICAVWRRMARALAEAGTSTRLELDPFYGAAQARARQEVQDLLNNPPGKVFLGGFPTAGDSEQAATIARLRSGRRGQVVLTTMIERDRIGPLSVRQANLVDQWWLPNAANVEAFRSSGVQGSRLHVVHVPFFPDDPHQRLVGRAREAGPTHFYRIGVVDQRKDQAKMLLAFLRAFRPGEAKLTVKTTNMAYELYGLWLDDPAVAANGWDPALVRQDVQVVHALWEESQMVDLHRRGDVYLSLSHGEGWDMPAFDALLSGNRMIYTESGGPQEFAAEGDIRVPTSRMTRCDPRYRWEPDAMWIDFDVDEAARAMREAHENPLPKTQRRSWAGFTSADVGALMKRLLDASHAPRPVPTCARRGSLAVVSLFRQCEALVPEYRRRLEGLAWPTPVQVVTVEGDSTDRTPDLLDAWARENANVHSLHLSLGNPLYGSTLNATRLKTLATVSNHGLDYIARHLQVEYVLFLTSDLMYAPDFAAKLRAVLEQDPRRGLVAPMVWRDNGFQEIFYDTWAFRRGQHRDALFDGSSKAELLRQLGRRPLQMQAVGSVLFCRSAPIYAGVRFTPEQDVVGFSENMRAAGYTIWADPNTELRHPREVFPQEVRALPNNAEHLADRLLVRWTGKTTREEREELRAAHTHAELAAAQASGPKNRASVEEHLAKLLVVYQPNSIPHGVASHAMLLRDAHGAASWMTSLSDALAVARRTRVGSVVFEVQWGCWPTYDRITPEIAAVLSELRSRGVRLVADFHHAEDTAEWKNTAKSYAQHFDQMVFYHPSGPEFAGGGIYRPLPVPQFRRSSSRLEQTLVFAGFADPSRRIDKLVAVAEEVGRPIYGYGPRLDKISTWYDTRAWTQFRPGRAYLDERRLAEEVSRHTVALLARAPSSKAYSSASARFCMGCGVAVVADLSRSYEDLRGVIEHANFDDGSAVTTTRKLLEDRDFLSEVLRRQERYAEENSFEKLLESMGVQR